MAISAWTDSAKQLSGLLFGDPAQRDAALERELNQAKVKRELAETEKLGYENQGLAALGGPEFFKGPDGKLRDVTDIAGAMMRAGKMDAGNFGDMYQALSGMNLNDPSFAATIPNPEQFGRNAALAAGNLANENTAITTGWADSMATRDTNNAIRQRNAQPRSETEVLAAALGSLPMNEQVELARMKQLPSEVAQYEYGVTTPAYREYEMQNKSKAPGFRMTTDANGNPVIEYGTDFGAPLTSTVTTGVQKDTIKLQDQLAAIDMIGANYNPAFNELPTKMGMTALSLQDWAGMDLAPEQSQALTEFSRYRSASSSATNEKIKEFAGTAVSAAEAQRLLTEMPNAGTGIFDGDGPTQYEAKLGLVKEKLKAGLVRYQDLLVKGIVREGQGLPPDIEIQYPLESYMGGKTKPYEGPVPIVTPELSNVLGSGPSIDLGRKGMNTPSNPGSVGQGTNPALTTPYDQIVPEPVRVTSDADYEILPSGTQFVAPDGTVRVKP